MYNLKGKSAYVTGSAQGIGRATALRLAQEGCMLALVDIDEPGLAITAEAVEHAGSEAISIVADVSQDRDVSSSVRQAVESLGDVDFLVNAAGVASQCDFLELSESEWDRNVDVNLKGTFLTCKLLGRHMADRGSGSIVNIASIAAKTGVGIQAHYCASKGGVVLLTQSAALALAPFHITVNAVCPGFVWTDMMKRTSEWLLKNDPRFVNRGLTAEEVYLERVEKEVPLAKRTDPEDVAGVIAFLLSDEAALITGQAINVDGGLEFH
jgi:NAD(P)-dependent dehydrogenase (short-subunit alcohol dehydrogenase family)